MTVEKKNFTVTKKQEVIVNDSSKLHATFEPGDVTHQGDVIVVAIRALPPSATPRANRQVTAGDTQGSRHIVDRGDVYDCDLDEVAEAVFKAAGVKVDNAYIGPVFVSPDQPTADDLSHPEHGNQGFPPGAVCAVLFQRNLDAEEREARVED